MSDYKELIQIEEFAADYDRVTAFLDSQHLNDSERVFSHIILSAWVSNNVPKMIKLLREENQIAEQYRGLLK